MFAMIDVLWFAGGFALCWYAREPVTIWYKGVEDHIGALNDKIKALSAKK